MRYAISVVPSSQEPLGRQGGRWLGRDVHDGESLLRPHFPGLDDQLLESVTRAPARHGFQAAVVAPFRLRDPRTQEELLAALDRFCRRHHSLRLSALRITHLNDFFSLQPASHSPAMQELAALCIREFDRFRAALTPSEMARGKASQLSGQEKNNLEIWGHPYVFEQYRFQFPLTSRINNHKDKERIHAAINDFFGSLLDTVLSVDSLCLCVEPAPGQPMCCSRRFPLVPSPFTPGECPDHAQHPVSEDLYPGYQCHPA